MALITGLNFGPLPNVESDMQTPFLYLFPENADNVLFGQVIDLLHQYSQINKDGVIARKLAVVYLIHKLVFVREPKYIINPCSLILVDDPFAFNQFSWGSRVYDDLVREWSGFFYKCLPKEDPKEAELQLKLLVFPFALQCWFLEGLSPKQYGCPASQSDNTALSRLRRWSAKIRPDYQSAKLLMFNHDEFEFTVMGVEQEVINTPYYQSVLR